MNKTTFVQRSNRPSISARTHDMLQRKCACGNQTISGGECAECKKKKNGLQRKLVIGASNDPLEREADRVAERVMRMPESGSQHRLDTMKESLPPASVLRRRSGSVGENRSEAPSIVNDALSSEGKPLDSDIRQFMETRFGWDFSQVKLHTGAQAADSARSVNSLAYTLGPNIVFGTHQYQPHTKTGKTLLAHELTHVIQQSGGNDINQPVVARQNGDASAHKRPNRWSRPSIGRDRMQISSRPVRAELQRLPIEDPIHTPLIEEYRRQHGFPPGGVNESGRREGPSDAEIKYVLLPKGALLPLCPDVGNLEAIKEDFKDPKFRELYKDVNCLSSESQSAQPACRFTASQMTALKDAQKIAAERTKRGLYMINSGKEGRDFAQETATRLFGDTPPTIREVVDRLVPVRDFLSGSAVRFAGRTCGDEACQRGAVAYVTGARSLPINICPTAFSRPSSLHRTVLHEALHWSGLDADPTTPEGYCSKFDCKTPCLTKEDADAWSHYLDCLGKPFEIRRDFREKILESVDELP